MDFKLFEIGGYIFIKFYRLFYIPEDFEFLEMFGIEYVSDRFYVSEESENFVLSVLYNAGFIECL
jgi:hypothetical protein